MTPEMTPEAQEEQRRKNKRDNQNRLRRAQSWCARGLQEGNSKQETFLFLWIAFNAAYGVVRNREDDETESTKFRDFLQLVVLKDKEARLAKYLGKIMASGVAQQLMSNKYLYQSSWDEVHHQGALNMPPYNHRHYKAMVHAAKKNDAAAALGWVMSRLYTLRNQMLHGGVTYGDSWGQSQLRDGSKLMLELVPLILDIIGKDIEKNPASTHWGPVAYPRFRDDPE